MRSRNPRDRLLEIRRNRRIHRRRVNPRKMSKSHLHKKRRKLRHLLRKKTKRPLHHRRSQKRRRSPCSPSRLSRHSARGPEERTEFVSVYFAMVSWLTHIQVKMNRMRLRIAERLKQSQNTAASLTTFNEVDMSNIMEFRKLYKDDVLKKTGVKLGFMSAFARACILAMKEIPAVNASIEGPGGGDTIVYRDYVDVSVAVATPKGLVTPVVRNAESLDMIGIEQAIAELGKKVRRHQMVGTALADNDRLVTTN